MLWCYVSKLDHILVIACSSHIGLWLPSVSSSPQLSNIILKPLLCFLLYSLFMFVPGPFKLSPLRPHFYASSTFLLSSFSFHWNLQPAICQSLACRHNDMCVHTHRHKERRPSRPQELLWCIMTDNWPLWVCPRPREPITVTATSPWPVLC